MPPDAAGPSHQVGEAEYEAAINALTALVGEVVLVIVWAGESIVASTGGELIDAVPMRPGTEDETIIFRVLGGGSFLLDRQSFRGFRLHLGETSIEGVTLDLGGVDVGIQTTGSLP